MSFSCFLFSLLVVASVVASAGSTESGDLPDWFTNAFGHLAEESDEYTWLPCDSVGLKSGNDNIVTCSDGLILQFVDATLVVPNPTSCPTSCDNEVTCVRFAESLNSEYQSSEIVVLPTTAQDALAAAGENPVTFYIKDQFYAYFSSNGPVTVTFGSTYTENDN